MNGVSVIVCTYNGSLRLHKTLQHLIQQDVDDNLLWEIIVVDNNSSDASLEIAKSELDKYQIKATVQLLVETKPGKVYALDTAVDASLYDTLIICDDDNWLSKNFVQTSCDLMRSNLQIGIAVGCSSAAFENDHQPDWFKTFELAFAVGKIMPQSGNANNMKHLAGAGMVIRKEIFTKLKRLNYSPILTGRKGKTLASGEDSELSLLALYLGYDLYYDEMLHFTHYMPLARMNWKYCVRMISKGIALSRIQLYFYNYCFTKISQGKPFSFEYAYRRSWIKPLKDLKNMGISNLFFSLNLLVGSVEGSQKEIRVKSNLNKLRFVLENKKTLKDDFERIRCITEKIVNIQK